jgi:two-component system cell cycle response regulator
MDARRVESVSRSSAIDPLTRVFNRRYLADRLPAEVDFAMRSRTRIAVLFADVDGLKRLNDRFGHFAGDRALCAIATHARRTLRPEDLFGRYGGNEFVILARESDAAATPRLAEGLRRAIEGMRVVAGREQIQVTISVGVASLAELARRDSHVFGLLALAEGRMNEAKSLGGNRVCASPPSAPTVFAKHPVFGPSPMTASEF